MKGMRAAEQVSTVYLIVQIQAGAFGGPIFLSRVNIEVEVAGSNRPKGRFLSNSAPAGRERESVSWRNSMQTDEHKKPKGGRAEPDHMRGKNEEAP